MTPTRGVRPALMEAPMRPSGWSLKDLAAHFAAMNTVTLRALEELHQGRAFDWQPFADRDAQNQKAIERRRGQSLKHVLSEFRITHTTLMEAVRRVPDEHLYLNGEVPPWLRERTIDHYAHHTPAVEAWVAGLKAEGQSGSFELPVKQD